MQEFHLRWGQKERENNSQNTNRTKHSLHIHRTAAWLQFLSDSNRRILRSREGEFGQRAFPLLQENTGFIYIVKRWEGEKSTTEVRGFSATKHHWILSAVTKAVPDLCSVQRHGEKPKLCYCKCPNTAKSHQPMGTARGKPLEILEKRHKSSQKQPVKMEGDNISNDLAHEQGGCQ